MSLRSRAIKATRFAALPTSLLAAAVFATACFACDRQAGEQKQSQQTAASNDPKGLRLEQVEGVAARAVTRELTGRFTQKPALVASPCGFYLVASGREWSLRALIPGRELAWSQSKEEGIFAVDDVLFEAGIVDVAAMGGQNKLGQDLLQLHGQWEVEWLRKETGSESLAVKENARGSGQRNPRLQWRSWSVTLPTPVNVAGARIRRIIYGTAAAGSMVLVVRALLTEESQALRALKRVVFAVDSLDVRSEPTKQGEFLADLREEAAADPQCDAVLSTHSQQLE